MDAAGNVLVADRGSNRVVKLDAKSNTQTDLPFTGLNHPDGVAVDAAGTVYVTDSDNDRVLKLDPGSNTPSVLPFTGLTVPSGIAVDTAGAVYVTDHESHKVMKLDRLEHPNGAAVHRRPPRGRSGGHRLEESTCRRQWHEQRGGASSELKRAYCVHSLPGKSDPHCHSCENFWRLSTFIAMDGSTMRGSCRRRPENSSQLRFYPTEIRHQESPTRQHALRRDLR